MSLPEGGAPPAHRIEFVDLGREGDSDWHYSENGEFRVIRASDGAVVMAFKVSRVFDNTEWPERHYVNGPKEVRLSDDGRTVTCVFSGSHATGFTFEGNPFPDVRERYSLETLERLDP